MMLTNSPAFAVGMMIAGLAAGTVFYFFRLKKNGLPGAAALWAALLGTVLVLPCAKIGYLLHDLFANLFDGYFDEVWSLQPEHLSFIGGCLGFIAGVLIAAKICGIRPAKALDLFAAPGCVFLCLARIAEGGMDTLGTSGAMDGGWYDFFPLTMHNSWGDPYLSVFVLEALTALACLVFALKQQGKADREGLVFEKTAVCLLGAQVGWEMLLQYPYARSFYWSFVSLEQVICAVLFVILVIRGCVKNQKWVPLPVMLALFGCSAFFQFLRDNKIEFIFNEGWEWLADNAWTISNIAFILISVGLVFTGLAALRPKSGSKKE